MPHNGNTTSLSMSWHYFGYCADIKFPVNSEEVYYDVIKPNEDTLLALGMTAIEDIEYTKGRGGRNGWIHTSMQPVDKVLDQLIIIKP